MDEIHALVVDNSPVIRKILSYILEAEGCRVETAGNGLEALDCIGRQRPDIIFIDLIMPKIDGEKLGYIVRNTPELEDIFLVILSGVALEDYEITLRIGADVCIAKGPMVTMKEHVVAALDRFRRNQRGQTGVIHGLEGLHAREVTSELLVSKKHREVILQRMAEGVIELDNKGRVVMVNEAAVGLFGLPEVKILSSPLVQLLPAQANERFITWLDRLERGDACGPLVFSYDDPLQLGTQQVTLNLVSVAEGSTFFVIGILQNVTRRKVLEQRQRQLEGELQRIRKLEAMSLMAGGISHDFNNLLTIIRGNVEMARYVCQQENIGQMLEEANKAISLATQLIHQFSTFSNNYVPQKSQVYLLALIAEVLDQELAHTDICFELHCKENDFIVNVDPHLVQQVFVNLASNAVDAMAGVGRIDVHVDRVNGNEESVRIGQLVPKGELIRLVFTDSGPGIPLKSLDQVFDPYFSTKQKGAQKGMGLGLTIVHAIAKKHGGSVHILPVREGGCRVVLYFPLHEIADAEHRLAHRQKQGRRVLIIDDEAIVRIPTKKMFEHFGCLVTEALNVEEAVTLYRSELEAGRPFDLVLLDLHMPRGVGKADVAGEILTVDPKAVLVAVSGDRNSMVMRRYGDYGFVFAMEKPFTIETIEEVVNRFL